jgi:hypothetical protein
MQAVCRHKVSGVPRIFIRDSHVIVRKGQFLSFIVDSFIQHVQFLFSNACILKGMCMCMCMYVYVYVDTYLWPCIVAYPLFVRRHFVVCRHMSDKSGWAAGEERLRNTDIDHKSRINR